MFKNVTIQFLIWSDSNIYIEAVNRIITFLDREYSLVNAFENQTKNRSNQEGIRYAWGARSRKMVATVGSNQRLGRTNEKKAADLNSWLLFQVMPHSETAYSHFFSLLGPWRTYLSETINEQVSNTNLLKALTWTLITIKIHNIHYINDKNIKHLAKQEDLPPQNLKHNTQSKY